MQRSRKFQHPSPPLRYYGDNPLGPEISVVGLRVMEAVAAEECGTELEAVIAKDIENLIEGFERKSADELAPPGNDGDKGQVVASDGDDEVVEKVSKMWQSLHAS